MIHSDNDFATVAYLRVKQATLEDKQDRPASHATTPDSLSEESMEVQKAADVALGGQIHSAEDQDPTEGSTLIDVQTQTTTIGRWTTVAGVEYGIRKEGNPTLKDEVTGCFQIIRGTVKLWLLRKNCTDHSTRATCDSIPRHDAYNTYQPVSRIYG